MKEEDYSWKSYRGLLCYFLTMTGIVILLLLCGCTSRALKKENEQLREELARQQQYVPLKVDTIRDTVQMISQQVVEVEVVKEVLSKDDKELLNDLHVKLNDLENYQKIGTRTEAEVTLAEVKNDSAHSKPDKEDSILAFRDAWLDLKYNSKNNNLLIHLRDSLAISVEREYKKKFLWWKWGVKGYEVKAVSFSPYSTIKYNTYVKRKR